MSESESWRAKRDKQTADDVGAEWTLKCAAKGCPNRWSVDAGRGRLCSAHAWVPALYWPAVTQEQNDAQMERSMQPQARPRVTVALTHAQVVDLLQSLRAVAMTPKDSLQWARRLREREQAGDKLTQFQRECWRRVMRPQHDDGVEPGAVQPIAAGALPPAMRDGVR